MLSRDEENFVSVPCMYGEAAASDAGPYQVFFETGKSVLDDKAQAAVKKAAAPKAAPAKKHQAIAHAAKK